MKRIAEYINRHKTATFIAAFSVLALVMALNIPTVVDEPEAPIYAYTNRAVDTAYESESIPERKPVDQTGVQFTPWDVNAASRRVPARAAKPYTIMVFMNGSDLESETGAGTFDLEQMLDAGLDSRNANLLVFTGGAHRWQNNLVPSDSCVIWELADGEITKLADVGLLNMGNPGTLAGFINFSMQNFPAEKFGLIMWDHGGGTIAGYGHDENFNNAAMTLADMDRALYEAGLKENKLEFLGFDTCLMSTVEMAVIASDYAKYMIATEDLAPGEGWNYYFLEMLNIEPHIDGAELGMVIVDYYMDYYADYDEDIINISVVDLSNVYKVMTAMGSLMSRCTESMMLDRVPSFTQLARRRGVTRTFGEGSPRDNESDMVDIGDMAYKLHDLFPQEAEALFDALDESVIYNKNNSGMYLSGLSTYYVYGGRDLGRESLDIYSRLNMDGDYTRYLYSFFNNLMQGGRRYRSGAGADAAATDEILKTELTAWKPTGDKDRYYMTGIKSDESDLWAEIYGEKVCIYKNNEFGNNTMYVIPAELNGVDCDVVVLFNEQNPKGKILGVRHSDGLVIQKGYDDLNEGDSLSFYYQTKYFSGFGQDGWIKGREHKIGASPMTIEWTQNDRETVYSVRKTDVWDNEHYGELTK